MSNVALQHISKRAVLSCALWEDTQSMCKAIQPKWQSVD